MNWLFKYWPRLGGILAVVIIAAVLVHDTPLTEIKSLAWLHFAILLLHQFEEYVYPGGFKTFFNQHIRNRIIKSPLTDWGILLVNVGLAWTFYLLAALGGEEAIGLTIGLLGVTILNGIMHTFMFLRLRMYNPGLITGLFLFIPFGLYFLNELGNYVAGRTLLLGTIVFVLGTALIPIAIRLTDSRNLPE